MRCPANTHKPSFHVNTNLMSKHNSGKGTSSGQRGGHMPTPNIEETMTEEELFEWLQNAVHAGAFDNFEFDDNYITDRDHLPLRVKYKISAIKIMNK